MINAVFSVVGEFNRTPNQSIKLSHVPRVGDFVELPVVKDGSTEHRELSVRTIVWRPFHHRGQDVYIVVGSPRPETTAFPIV